MAAYDAGKLVAQCSTTALPSVQCGEHAVLDYQVSEHLLQ